MRLVLSTLYAFQEEAEDWTIAAPQQAPGTKRPRGKGAAQSDHPGELGARERPRQRAAAAPPDQDRGQEPPPRRQLPVAGGIPDKRLARAQAQETNRNTAREHTLAKEAPFPAQESRAGPQGNLGAAAGPALSDVASLNPRTGRWSHFASEDDW